MIRTSLFLLLYREREKKIILHMFSGFLFQCNVEARSWTGTCEAQRRLKDIFLSISYVGSPQQELQYLVQRPRISPGHKRRLQQPMKTPEHTWHYQDLSSLVLRSCFQHLYTITPKALFHEPHSGLSVWVLHILLLSVQRQHQVPECITKIQNVSLDLVFEGRALCH